MTDVGTFYIRGDYVERDPGKAYSFLDEAANRGDIRGNLKITEMLERGDLQGVKDPMGAVARRMAASAVAEKCCESIEWPCPESDPLDSRNAAALKTKIEQGFEVNTRSQDGHNTMHCAAATKDIELAKLASSKGVNADATNRDGVTPLHLAAQSGSYEIVVLLIGNGADVMPRRI